MSACGTIIKLTLWNIGNYNCFTHPDYLTVSIKLLHLLSDDSSNETENWILKSWPCIFNKMLSLCYRWFWHQGSQMPQASSVSTHDISRSVRSNQRMADNKEDSSKFDNWKLATLFEFMPVLRNWCVFPKLTQSTSIHFKIIMFLFSLLFMESFLTLF